MASSHEVAVCFSLAVAENGVIGKDGKLPWKLPNDMKRFVRLSKGKPIVMGRTTFVRDLESVPLKGRANIVVTRNLRFIAEGVEVKHTIQSALARAVELARGGEVGEVHVIGGAEIYQSALPFAQRIYLTQVHASPAGDTFMEPFPASEWQETECERHEADERHAYAYSFITLERTGEPRHLS